MRPSIPQAALVSSFAAVALLTGCGASSTAAAEPVSAEQVETILGVLNTGPVAFERAVVVDLRSSGTPFIEARLNDRFTELVRRENDERARIEYRRAERPRSFTVISHDGDTFLEAPRGRIRRAVASVPPLLRGLLPAPILAKAIAGIDEASSADGSRRLHVRLKTADPARLVGAHLDEVLSIDVDAAIRTGTESADVVLTPDGRLSRVTHRLRLALDGGSLIPLAPRLGPQGVVRIRISSTLRVIPQVAGVEVAGPEPAGGATEFEQIRLFREPTATESGVSDPDARPSGDRRAIRLARGVSAAFRGESEFEIVLRPSIPGSTIPVRARVLVRDGIVEGQRTTIAGAIAVVETSDAAFSRDERGGCWRRDPSGPTGVPFMPFEVGRPLIWLRGSRFFAPERRGKTVRIVAERTVVKAQDRVRYTLDRRTGRLLAVETLLHRGRVMIRPDLTVGPPTPVC